MPSQKDFEEDDSQSQSTVFISCYEVFLETLTDLLDETNEQFQTEKEITWIQIPSLEQAEQTLKTIFLNRKQIVDENELSYS